MASVRSFVSTWFPALLPALLVSLVSLACGGDSGGPAPDAALQDGGPDGPGGPDGGDPDARADGGGPDGGSSGDVGTPCGFEGDCTGNYCITEADGWPLGYCTHVGCDLAAPDTSCLAYGGDGLCFDVGNATGACFDRCDPTASDCRAGYDCVPVGGGVAVCLPGAVCGNGTVETGEECDPPNTAGCDANCQGIGTAAVGNACGSAADCAGDYCIPDADGWPDGYCTELECDLAAPETSCLPYGGDGICLDVSGDPTAPFGACFDRCDPTAPDCRTGYACVDYGAVGLCLPSAVCGNGVVEQGEECDPPNTATCDASCQGIGGGPIGEACASAADCSGNYCIPDADGWPMGYCTQLDCDLAAPDTSCLPHGGDGVCVDVNGDPTMPPYGVCFDRCDPTAPDCRTGYECLDYGGVGLCVPSAVCGNGVVEQGEECDPPNTAGCDANCQGTGTAAVGEACTAATDCVGDHCFTEADGWPMGYCSELDCDLAAPDTSCAAFGGDAVCVDVGGPGMPYGVCLDRCMNMGQCRTGYTCQAVAAGTSVCAP